MVASVIYCATTFTNVERNFLFRKICHFVGVKAFLARWKLQPLKSNNSSKMKYTF